MFEDSLRHHHGLKVIVRSLGGIVVGAAAVLLANRLFGRATTPRAAVETRPAAQPLQQAVKPLRRTRTRTVAKRAAPRRA